MKFKLLVLALGIATSGVAIADYQAEVGVNASRYSSDFLDSDNKTYGVTGAYYFSPVKTSGLPLAEAAYLGKNNNIFAGIIKTPRQDWFPSSTGYVVGAEFYMPENFLYVSGGATYVDVNSGDNRNDWFVSVGITPIDGLLVTTDYSNDAGYDLNINAKYVTQVGGHFINLEGGVVDTDYGTYTNVGGDFYFDNTFSVGGMIQHGDDDNAYQIRTRKFFTEAISGGLAYTDGEDENAVAVDVSFRF